MQHEPETLEPTDCPLLGDHGERLLSARKNLLDTCKQMIHEGLIRKPELFRQLEIKHGENIAELFSEIDRDLKKRELSVGLLGGSGVGKSSVGNAILGKFVFPSSAAGATTAVITRVAFSVSARVPVYRLKNKSREELRGSLTQLLQNSSEAEKYYEGMVGKEWKDLHFSRLRNLLVTQGMDTDQQNVLVGHIKAEQSDDPKGIFGLEFNTPKETGDRSIADELSKYAVTAEGQSQELCWLKEISLTLPSKDNYDINIIDVPGVGSSRREQTILAEKTIGEVDGVIVFSQSPRAFDSIELIELFDSFKRRFKNTVGGRAFGVVTKLDSVEPDCQSNTDSPAKLLGDIEHRVADKLKGFDPKKIAFCHGILLNKLFSGGRSSETTIEQARAQTKTKENFYKTKDWHVWRSWANENRQSTFSDAIISWCDDSGYGFLNKLVYQEFPDEIRKGLVSDSVEKLSIFRDHLQQILEGLRKAPEKDFQDRCSNTMATLVSISNSLLPQNRDSRSILATSCFSALGQISASIQDTVLNYQTCQSGRNVEGLQLIYASNERFVRSKLDFHLRECLGKFESDVAAGFAEAGNYELGESRDFRKLIIKAISESKQAAMLELDQCFESKYRPESGTFPEFPRFKNLMVRKAYFSFRRVVNLFIARSLRMFEDYQMEIIRLQGQDRDPLSDEKRELIDSLLNNVESVSGFLTYE